MLDLSRLSLEQRQAVLAGDGPLLIVAGPGSGKTTVLAARIAYLVLARHVAPASVLAITFATKAARELRARLVGLLAEQGQAVDVTTFHAFGLRIIRQWGEELGFGAGPVTVYDAEDARAVLRQAAETVGLELARSPPTTLASDIHRYRLGDPTLPPSDDLARLATAYEAILQRRHAVDFTAMLALPLRLFDSHPDALRLYQAAYRHVLADEFQDMCLTQYTLLRRLVERHGNLVVVGDPCQNIYAWRGADLRCLLDFQRDFPTARVLHLHHNFRSTRRIVAVANALGARLPYGRPLRTDNPPGVHVRLHEAGDEKAEAGFVAHEIQALREAGHIDHLGDVAILYRTNHQAQALGVALRRATLPYYLRGHGDLFERREVRDVLAYLRLAHNPADVEALRRIVNVPPRRLGQLAGRLRQEPQPLEALPSLVTGQGHVAEANAEGFVALVEHLHCEAQRLRPAILLDLALEASGYRAWLSQQADGSARLEHLLTVRRMLEAVEGDLGEWLAELQADDVDDARPDETPKVLLTTLHGAKGGEWRVVFVVGIEEGLLPHARALAAPPADAGAVEGERRAAYVAVTRPRERLYLSYCNTRQWGATPVPRQPSRFLQDLPRDLLHRIA